MTNLFFSALDSNGDGYETNNDDDGNDGYQNSCCNNPRVGHLCTACTCNASIAPYISKSSYLPVLASKHISTVNISTITENTKK